MRPSVPVLLLQSLATSPKGPVQAHLLLVSVTPLLLNVFQCYFQILMFCSYLLHLDDLRADIRKITDKFFAPGPIVNFLDAFVRGEKHLEVTTGNIQGLPRAWRRQFGHPADTRPSLLLIDLSDPSSPDSASRILHQQPFSTW